VSVQGTDSIVIDASVESVWCLLENGARLPEWMPLVKRTDSTRELLGAVRHCDVALGSRVGSVVERCVECDPPRRIAWRMESDTFGMSRYFADFGFGFALEPINRTTTRVRTETSFRPRTVLARVLTALVLRRKYRAVRRMALDGLKRLVELDTRGG